MSSHILLSRGVARPHSEPIPTTHLDSPTLVTSIFESGARHVMTLGNATSHRNTISGLDGVGTDTQGRDKSHTIPSATELDPSAKKRSISRSSTLFDDPTDPRAALDDHLLEPCPGSRIRSSVSEVLHGATTTGEGVHASLRRSFTLQSLGGADKLIAEVPRPCRMASPAPTFSGAECERLEYMACMPARRSSAAQLPTEVVQHILYLLAPAAFNSAMRSCRSWFLSGLNSALLKTMLRRAGYSDGIVRGVVGGSGTSSAEWLMSKRLALECALGPDSPISPSSSSLYQTAAIDFTEIEVHYPGPDLASTIFTVSSCGRFLMAAHGCLVYLYELNRSHKSAGSGTLYPGRLRPVTSIICPRRVLACSMDTSSQRYAIAILLDGRMGLVCDVTALSGSSTASPPASEPSREAGGIGTKRTDMAATLVLPELAPSGTTGRVDNPAWHDVPQGDEPSSTRTASPNPYMIGPDGTLREPTNCTSMPVENGPRSMYRNLCSEDDPPRSVAICPQRRCVAFGCSSGLELHWVDALTGQDLNRWFPLTAPSDYLFFLPPRKSVDSAKKLRLISSAGRPSERTPMSSRAFGHSSRTSPFWERLGRGLAPFEEDEEYGAPGSAHGILTRLRLDATRSSVIGRMDCSDHYRAVPLSDGYHILFTDPASGLLCLGSDAPVGGPTKLLRKIWFHVPSEDGTAQSATPVAYTAGSDLSQGVRIVAAFEDGAGGEQSVWLFSVPRDIFTASQTKPASSTTAAWLHASASRGEAAEEEWKKWWPNDGLQQWLSTPYDPAAGMLPRSVWPVKIRGKKIGTCKGLVDLAVDARSMSIWAFTCTGFAAVWRLTPGSPSTVRNIIVVRDGTVREVQADGDVEMSDAVANAKSSLDGRVLTPVHTDSFDGAGPGTVRFDGEGDLVMAGLCGGVAGGEGGMGDASGGRGVERFRGTVAWQIDMRPRTKIGTRVGYISRGRVGDWGDEEEEEEEEDWAEEEEDVEDDEEALGLARIELEIR
ncbi:F-box domain-containing protein [Diplocarpon rosae]|nr:F-box domain-containing protein [Diplocarpon rosae]